jgi:methylthioribose-1-phosphate isomerase
VLSLNVFLIFFKLITGSQIFIEEKLENSFKDSQTFSQAAKESNVLFQSFHQTPSDSSKFS